MAWAAVAAYLFLEAIGIGSVRPVNEPEGGYVRANFIDNKLFYEPHDVHLAHEVAVADIPISVKIGSPRENIVDHVIRGEDLCSTWTEMINGRGLNNGFIGDINSIFINRFLRQPSEREIKALLSNECRRSTVIFNSGGYGRGLQPRSRVTQPGCKKSNVLQNEFWEIGTDRGLGSEGCGLSRLSGGFVSTDQISDLDARNDSQKTAEQSQGASEASDGIAYRSSPIPALITLYGIGIVLGGLICWWLGAFRNRGGGDQENR